MAWPEKISYSLSAPPAHTSSFLIGSGPRMCDTCSGRRSSTPLAIFASCPPHAVPVSPFLGVHPNAQLPLHSSVLSETTGTNGLHAFANLRVPPLMALGRRHGDSRHIHHPHPLGPHPATRQHRCASVEFPILPPSSPCVTTPGVSPPNMRWPYGSSAAHSASALLVSRVTLAQHQHHHHRLGPSTPVRCVSLCQSPPTS